MKGKLLNTLLIVTSLLAFLEWGQNKQMFLFQIEAELFSKIPQDPFSILHPLVLLPLIGQFLLLFTLVQKKPGNLLTYIGIGGIGILILLIFLVGCIDFNLKILFSTLPFLAIGFFTIRHRRKMAVNELGKESF